MDIDELPTHRSTMRGERVVGEQLSIRNGTTGELIPLLVNSAPVRNDEGEITGAVTTFQDITTFKEFERQKDEFLQTLSHDLKNPLTSVKGNAQFLRRRALRQGLDLLPVIDRIESSAVQAVVLIDELLDLTRLQMGRPVELVRSRTNLIQLVTELAEQQAATSRFHLIRVQSRHMELIGHVDEIRVARVLSNLLNNAIKYSPDNSEIVIEVDAPIDDPGWVEIRVIDQGIGIPEEDLPRLFERFRRGSNVEGQIRGSGLGLASSKQIVEQHGGRIIVRSVEGEGSTFTVLLPLQPHYVPR
jgi:signal transduction histidine kinase